MREQPGHIDQRELARTLHEQWGLAPGRLRHLPVGFGDHHWELTDAVGGGWFITVAELAGGWRGTGPAAGYADLRAAMETVTALRRAGLEFAIAPVPTASGQALAPLDDGHAITVFPYLDGAPADFGDELTAGDRLALVGMRWSLDDIALAVRDFRAPHEQNEDTGLTWEALTGEIGEIA